MPRAISGSPQDLKLLKAGLCPDCGAAVTAGMVACAVCKTSFGAHASVLQPLPSAVAAPRAAPAAAMARAPALLPTSRGLTAEQIDELERGMHARSLFPHTFAEGPENGAALALGSALARGALLVMADAALVDDPLVLASGKPTPTAIPRVKHNVASSSAAMVDDAPPMTSSPPARAPAQAPAHAVAQAPGAASARAPARGPAPPAHAIAAPPPTAPDTRPFATTAPVATAIPPSEEPETVPEQPAFDPDATQKHDADEMARTIKAAQELIAARGGAQRLE